MIPFPDKKYQIILADPPWKYPKRRKDTTFGLGMHRYKGMTLEELTRALDVRSIADDNCALFMWHVPPKYDEYPVGEIFGAWGFRYVTKAFTWIKLSKEKKPRLLPGHYTGSNSEDCFLGIRGRMIVQNKGVNQVIFSPLTAHSQKPLEVMTRIVDLFGDLPRIELFARERIEGWDAWGDEVNITDEPEIEKEETNMTLEDIMTSITDMSEEELQDALMSIRASRRDTVRRKQAVGRENSNKKKKKKSKVSSMSATDAQLLLDQIMQIKEGEKT